MPVILTLINLTMLPSFEFVYFFHKYFFATFILYKRSLSVSIMKSVSEIHDLVAITFSYGSRIMYDKRSNLSFVGNTPCLLPRLQREPGSWSCQHRYTSVTAIVTCHIVHIPYIFSAG